MNDECVTLWKRNFQIADISLEPKCKCCISTEWDINVPRAFSTTTAAGMQFSCPWAQIRRSVARGTFIPHSKYGTLPRLLSLAWKVVNVSDARFKCHLLCIIKRLSNTFSNHFRNWTFCYIEIAIPNADFFDVSVGIDIPSSFPPPQPRFRRRSTLVCSLPGQSLPCALCIPGRTINILRLILIQADGMCLSFAHSRRGSLTPTDAKRVVACWASRLRCVSEWLNKLFSSNLMNINRECVKAIGIQFAPLGARCFAYE